MQLQATITDIEIVKIPSITAKISLRNQIFVAMIFLVLLACLLILTATYFQYQNESEDYNLFRLNRKEIQLRNQISYLVNTNNLENKSDDHWIKYKDDFEKKGLIFSALSPDGTLPEIIELKNHPWFVGVQFHPEFKSRPFTPHPLFSSFVKAVEINMRRN